MKGGTWEWIKTITHNHNNEKTITEAVHRVESRVVGNVELHLQG
jgi:hypothetical protein